MTNVNEVLEGHVALEVESVDRLYLNAYVAKLQVPGQVARFLHDHLGLLLPSPAAFEKISNRFRRNVRRFAEGSGIPVLRLKKPDRTRWDDRKLDHVGPYLRAAEDDGRFGVVAIVATQEFQWVFSARNSRGSGFTFFKEQRRVGTYYFYVLDPDFGPGFIKICTYFPYPAKVWVNGHEWAKRQAAQAGIGFRPLANGFAACDDPAALQDICDHFGPEAVQGFFDRWIGVIPVPFTGADRDAGYWWELSVRQVEVSRTLVFDHPSRARGFFEALVADNIGIGRPQEVSAVFARRLQHNTPGIFRTRIFDAGTDVRLEFAYKRSRVKEYLKEGKALRIETVINKPSDVGCLARLQHLPELIAKGRDVNRRLLMIERAGQGCAIGSALFERIHQPYIREGQQGVSPSGGQVVMTLGGTAVPIRWAERR